MTALSVLVSLHLSSSLLAQANPAQHTQHTVFKHTFMTLSCSLDDEEVETVVVSAVLDMEYSRYLTQEDSVHQHFTEPLTVLGIKVVDIQAATYGRKQ